MCLANIRNFMYILTEVRFYVDVHIWNLHPGNVYLHKLKANYGNICARISFTNGGSFPCLTITYSAGKQMVQNDNGMNIPL